MFFILINKVIYGETDNLFSPKVYHRNMQIEQKLYNTLKNDSSITALVGTLSYLITGFNILGNPHSIGYIHLPSFLSIGLISVFTVPFGIKLADKLNVKILKKIFAVALIATSIFMFFK